MRVLQLLSSNSYHGAETMAAELVHQLQRLGVEVLVGILDNDGRGDREILRVTAGSVQEQVVLPCSGRWDRSTAGHLRDFVSSRRVDLIHSHKYKATFYALLARRCRGDTSSRGHRVPVVTTYHNWLYDTWALRVYAALDQRLARFCDAAVAVSAPIEDTLKRYVAPSRLWRVGNGVDVDRFCPMRQDERRALRSAMGWDGKRLLGFVGRLVRDKGIRYLLQAISELPSDAGASCHLAIIGDGPERGAIEAELRLRGLQARVSLLGNRSDVARLYPGLDLFVLPSLVEAFPMVVVEAMSCAIPVLATAVGDVATIVKAGTTGTIVAPADAVALREALAGLLLSNPERLQAMGVAGRERAIGLFSAQQMARNYVRIYESVLRH